LSHERNGALRAKTCLPRKRPPLEHGTPDFAVTTDEGETFGLSVFLRDGNDIYQTYFTDGRGVEYLGSNFSYLDLTPFGRQEVWEDSPEGWPQTPPYEWWKYHDRY
jgi:predicted dithiol-disulfide oxidoreductase (DUF899 family)